MAKYYNNKVKSGKLAGSVFAVRFGETIERAYNPMVSNPSTEGQVKTRAKFKLLSQMAAVFASVIAIPRNGAVSARNQFSKINFPAATVVDGEASIDLEAVKITRGVVALPALQASTTTSGVEFSLSEYATGAVNRVVYAIFVKQEDNTLRLYTTAVVSEPGENGRFSYTLVVGTGRTYIVYAYGVRDNTEAARIKFGELEVPMAEDIAKLVTSRQLTDADITVTETQAIQYAHTA